MRRNRNRVCPVGIANPLGWNVRKWLQDPKEILSPFAEPKPFHVSRREFEATVSLAREAGFKVVEETLPREMLYVADEVFFTGSAAEITPIRSVDKIVVGAGKCGPVTKRLQEEFFGIVKAEKEDRHHWLTYVKV